MTAATTSPVTRRAVLAGACVTCAGALVACSNGSPSTAAPTTGGAVPTVADAAPTSAAGSTAGTEAGAAGTAAADVPVGGGIVLAAQKIVITQPTAGTFAAFSATCTHQGCTVGSVKNGTIDCPCHGSKYAIADGSVVSGPAPRPLPRKTVTVDGTSLHVT